jgi:hypothetical protein
MYKPDETLYEINLAKKYREPFDLLRHFLIVNFLTYVFDCCS